MDDRYFHGLRSAAASALGLQARDEFRETALFHLDNAFHELFCLDSRLTRPNYFAERSAYNIQCAIPKAIARIRDSNGRAPFSVRRFLYEKLRYNDNSNNPYSDCYYLATLMKALAESMASVPPPSSDLFDPSDPDDNFRFHDLCLEEIDRYRRLDEWIPTYHNVLSTTALECNTILAQAGSVPKQLPLFLQYTQEGGYDDLRVVAFASLMELGAFKNDHVLKWFLFVLGTDSSPYMRFHMFRLFGKVLGTIAIGEDSDTAEVDRVPQEGNLVVQESSTEARQADLARKQTVSGATTALKAELSGRQSLEAPLWDAVCSQTLTIREVAELLTVCGLLYEPVTSCIVKLKMPRYWRATNMGPFPPSKPNGKPRYLVKFTQTKRVRLTPIPKRQPVPQAPLPKREGSVLVAPMPIKKMSLKPPKKPPASPVPPVPSAPIGEGRPTIKLKLKLPGTGGMPGAGGAQTPR